MNNIRTEERQAPQFVTDQKGKTTAVTLDTAAYVALLVQANVTDSALWPPGMQEGAAALARVREIETASARPGGVFDWEALPADAQDEYDSLCAFLDRLQDTGERIALRDAIHSNAKTGS
jgi:hypothetical protein